MEGINAGMLAVVAAFLVVSVGWLALQTMRAGWDYAAARGNPRNRAGAHESLWDIGKGAVLIVGAGGIAAFIIRTMVFT